MTIDSGLLLIDKDVGPTSFHAIAALRRLLGMKKIGHGGTLDPFASGLLPVAFGKATGALQEMLGLDKTYEARVRLGQSTDTGDSEGQITATCRVSKTELGRKYSHLDVALSGLTGPQWQTPPMHSAIRIEGKRLYEYARAGMTIERPPRRINVHILRRMTTQVVDSFVDVDLFMHVSSGTYVRQLAVSLGERLGLPAHVLSLRRTSVGPFQVDDAHRLDAWFEVFNSLDRNSLAFRSYLADKEAVLPLRAAYFRHPTMRITTDEARRAMHGQPLFIENGRLPLETAEKQFVLLDYNGVDLALATVTEVKDKTTLTMKKVWSQDESIYGTDT